jgi:malonyl-CoA O-methyltransferase
MIDKRLVSRRFARAIDSYNREAVAQRCIASRMSGLLERYVPPTCQRVLEIGGGTGFLTRHLVERIHPKELIVNDLCHEMAICYDDLIRARQAVFCGGDAERVDFPSGQDLIVSCSALQWFVDPAAFFARCHGLLAEGGYVAFSTFGSDNLREVSALTGAGLTYRSLAEWQRLLAPHYEVVEAREERITLPFATPLEVLYHLKHTGVTAVQPAKAWTRSDIDAFARAYQQRFSQPDGTVTLTYHPLYIIAKKKLK